MSSPDHSVRTPRVAAAARGLWAYLREVSGETAYERYVDHARRLHPDAPVLARRDFERQRQDERDRNPQARCC